MTRRGGREILFSKLALGGVLSDRLSKLLGSRPKKTCYNANCRTVDKFNNIFVRDISNKVMPTRNSPTNVTGETKNTMKNEYIVIFDK